MSEQELDVDMQNGIPDNPRGDLVDRAVAALLDAPLPHGPSPLVAQRTISTLWATELEAERNRSRWVIRIAAAIVLAVCAVATAVVLLERRSNFAQDRDQSSQPYRVRADNGSASNLHLALADQTPSIPTSEIMVTGHVYFEGTVPQRQSGDASADPQNSAAADESVDDGSLIVNEDGTLANVVISISGGLPANRQYEPPPPAVLDMRYSMFYPHVAAVMVGQSMVVRNDDRLPHNPIATDSMNAPYFNFALPGGSEKLLDPFTRAQSLRLTCDQYPWMHGLIKVFNHPFFDVTRSDGSFTLRELPPGTYRITAWHESLGTQEKQITIRGGEPLVVDFTFQPK